MTLRYLIQKEFTQIRHNAFLPRLIVMFPIMIMCVMPWVMNMEVKNIRVDVVDIDHTVESHRLIQQVAHSNYFIFNAQQPTYNQALSDVEHGKADVILEIRDKQYLIAANAVNGTKGSMGAAYMSQVISGNISSLKGNLSPLTSRLSPLYLYNKGKNYKLFMIPALFAIVIMLMTGFLPTLNIVGEKEAGTIEQINVTPVSKWAFILAKLIPYWIIAIFVMWFFVVLLMLLSGLFTPTRSMPTLAYLTTYVNPMHYFIEAIRTVFIRGGSLHSIWHQILALTAIALFMSTWAVQSYKKNS